MATKDQVDRIYEYMLANDQIDPNSVETHRLSVCRWNSVYISSQRLNSVHITFTWTLLQPLVSRKRVASTEVGPDPKKAPFNDPDYNLDLDGIHRPEAPAPKETHNLPSGSGLKKKQIEYGDSPSSVVVRDVYGPELSALRELEHEEQQKEAEQEQLIYDGEIQQRKAEEAVQKYEQRYDTHHIHGYYPMEIDSRSYLPLRHQGTIL